MYDWDVNGRVDPYDVGQSVSMGLYDEEEKKTGNKGKKINGSGCMITIIMIICIILSVMIAV